MVWGRSTQHNVIDNINAVHCASDYRATDAYPGDHSLLAVAITYCIQLSGVLSTWFVQCEG